MSKPIRQISLAQRCCNINNIRLESHVYTINPPIFANSQKPKNTRGIATNERKSRNVGTLGARSRDHVVAVIPRHRPENGDEEDFRYGRWTNARGERRSKTKGSIPWTVLVTGFRLARVGRDMSKNLISSRRTLISPVF